jgi:hypothetical protein
MVEAELLGSEADPPHALWVAAQLGLGIDDADLHPGSTLFNRA